MTTPDNKIELDRIQAETSKLIAETIKLNAEAAKMTRENWWYPFVIITASIASGVGLAKMLM